MRPLALPGKTFLPATLLVLFLAAVLPPFVCMPLWADVTLYDLAARNLLRGGVHYRDIFDTNLPGMVWLHAAIRAGMGWRSETIRLADFAIVGGIVCLLMGWLRRDGLNATACTWTTLALCGFYFSTTEGNHCQRDVWILLPALIALELRRRQVESRHVLLRSLVEGCCWGSAAWIKPFVVCPALVAWITSACLICRRPNNQGRVLAADTAGLLAGWLLAAGLGLAWLTASGTWPHFWDVIVNWLPEYATHGRSLLRRVQLPLLLFRPWGLVHVLAVPLAVIAIVRTGSRSLLAGFYLAWLFQAAFLQMDHEYVHVAAVLLGLTVLAARLGREPLSVASRWALGGVAVLLAAGHPALRAERLAFWGRCCQEGGSAELRDHLRMTGDPLTTDWVDLERVAAFLREQQLGDGELTCCNNFTHPLLLDLDLAPSMRVLHFDTVLSAFPSHRRQVCRELARSPQRFAVSDVASLGVLRAEWSALAAAPGGWARCFPWSEPVVFRSGRYAVHQVRGPVERLVPDVAEARAARYKRGRPRVSPED